MSDKCKNEANSYKIVNDLFERQQDFIVVGLCGKTGSGVSTVAQILRQEFDELNLNPEAPQGLSDYEKHEYHILYNYAKKNWSGFYLIKTRALIVARTLALGSERLQSFLIDLTENISDADKDAIKNCVNEFFGKEMSFSIDQQFSYCDKNGAKSKGAFSFDEFFNISKDPLTDTHLRLNAKGIKADKQILDLSEINGTEEIKTGEVQINDFHIDVSDGRGKRGGSETIQIKCHTDGHTISISNENLYKLFQYFQYCRESKKGNLNPIYYWILQEYIFSFLPEQVDLFWNDLRAVNAFKKIETIAMQLLGNNLRISDVPYAKDGKGNEGNEYPFRENSYITIAKDINHAIKILRAFLSKKTELNNIEKNENPAPIHAHALAVIDSIKNPFESMYLKQRYSNYYLIGVYTDENLRQQRLIKSKKFSITDIKAIDQVEQLRYFESYYKKHSENDTEKAIDTDDSPLTSKQLRDRIKNQKLENVLPFIIQNVSSCLESADIFINNPTDNDSYLLLKRTLVRYISLMMYPGIVLPTDLERCMQIAYVAKANSGCISRQVGAVVTDCNYELLSVGWNQQPKEQLPCLYRDLYELFANYDTEGYSDYENSNGKGYDAYKNSDEESLSFHDYVSGLFDDPNPSCSLKEHGRGLCFCFKDLYNEISGEKNQVHTRALHAEETAFLNLSGDSKQRTKGGYLFTTSSPCVLCSKKAKYLGIKKIYYANPYPDIAYSHIMMAGPKYSRPEYILFTGAIGTAYTRLFTPLLPIKDERELWLGHKIRLKAATLKTEDNSHG